jgi:probable F420-dependent oxidoreductase
MAGDLGSSLLSLKCLVYHCRPTQVYIKEATMNVGIFHYLSTAYSIDPAVLAKRAEALGFDSLWLPEHPIMPVTTVSPFPLGGPIPDFYAELIDPFVGLARASAVTKTIKLGTGICLVPERNPLLLAKEIATLDQLSGGRFIFGIGAGWVKEETEIMGGDFEHRWTQTQDAIMAMKALWTKDEAEYHGRYYDFPPIRSVPKPAQKPHPPIVLGSITSRRVFQRIVAWGDGWMPVGASLEQMKRGRDTLNQLAARAGRDPRSIQIVAFFVPPDPEALKAFQEAGADAALVALETAGEKEALARLEEIAQKVLP